MRLIARSKFTYATRVIQAGEEFDAAESDVALLCDTVSAPAQRKPRQTREQIEEDEEPDRQQHYRRRDMRAKR